MDTIDQILDNLRMLQNDEKALRKILKYIDSEILLDAYDSEEQEEEVYLKEIETVDDNRLEIPEAYRDTISEIAEYVNSGFVCYLNPETLEIEELPLGFVENPKKFAKIVGDEYDNMEIKHHSWETAIEITPLSSKEAFYIMEYFVAEVNDRKFAEDLAEALANKKPFSRFKQLIEESNYKEQWYAFRQEQWERQIWFDLQKLMEAEEEN